MSASALSLLVEIPERGIEMWNLILFEDLYHFWTNRAKNGLRLFRLTLHCRFRGKLIHAYDNLFKHSNTDSCGLKMVALSVLFKFNKSNKRNVCVCEKILSIFRCRTLVKKFLKLGNPRSIVTLKDYLHYKTIFCHNVALDAQLMNFFYLKKK